MGIIVDHLIKAASLHVLNAGISTISSADPTSLVTAYKTRRICEGFVLACMTKPQACSKVHLLPEYRAFAFMIGALDASGHTQCHGSEL